jgi:hypothetical protein
MDCPQALTPRFVHSYSRWSCAVELQMEAAVVPATGVWPTANKAFYYPIFLPFRFVVRRVFVANGGTVNGNWDVGVYSRGGTRIFSSGSTAQAGTSVNQYATLGTPVLLVPGFYYLAMASSSATGQYIRALYGNAAARGRHAGLLEQTTAFALPASATFAQLSAMYLPLFGLTSTSSGF